MKRLPKIFLSSLFSILLCACGNSSYQKIEGLIWNTIYHVTYQGDRALADSVAAVLNEVSKSLSVFDKSALVCKVNESVATRVDRHFIAVYLTSQMINRVSNGLFDPTLSPLITAWGFGPGHKITSDTTRIDSIMNFIGIGKTRLSGDTIIKEDIRTQFNFSAVAKGYGCDMIAEMFKRNGVKNYLIEIGGEIATGGVSPSNDTWKISIDRPVESDNGINHDATAVLSITDAGVATSGNYRNFHKIDGKSLGHTISPVTGRPIKTDIISATIVAPTCMDADAMATACMASGSEMSKEMLSALHYEGMLILTDSTIYMTPGFKALLR